LLAGPLDEVTPARAAGPARVTFDHLTWAPDGSALAAEARFESSEGVATDTLLIDLTEGSLSTREFRPSLFALDRGGARFTAISRYALVAGTLENPERLERLAGHDPARLESVRLAFSARGDSILLLTRARNSSSYELAAWPFPSGRQVVRSRHADRSSALRAFAASTDDGQPLAVEEVPFPHLYQTIGSNLFHLEPSQVPVPGVSSLWLFNLFHRNRDLGQSRLLATQVAPYECLVSPDSGWIAMAGHKARPDYGGRLDKSLWIASADGSIFFSVSPPGGRGPNSAAVRAMTWRDGHLWYSTPDGLFDLDPVAGRSRRVVLGAPAPAWSANLEAGTPLWTLLSRSGATDTVQAVRERESLREKGWPAWVATWQSGYRAAVGAEGSEAELQPLASDLVQKGETGFSAARVDAAASGSPFPWGVVRSPVDAREAYLVSAGPAGFTAGEIWLTERQGARQIRLVRAMLLAPLPSPGAGAIPGSMPSAPR
ncbi:MAG: hypothetical protein FD129_1392, partial [bacterium]